MNLSQKKKKNTRIYFKFLSFIFNFKKFNFNKLNFCLRVVLQFSCTDMLNATKPLSTTAILATEQLSESLVPSSVPCKRGFPETLTETQTQESSETCQSLQGTDDRTRGSESCSVAEIKIAVLEQGLIVSNKPEFCPPPPAPSHYKFSHTSVVFFNLVVIIISTIEYLPFCFSDFYSYFNQRFYELKI